MHPEDSWPDYPKEEHPAFCPSTTDHFDGNTYLGKIWVADAGLDGHIPFHRELIARHQVVAWMRREWRYRATCNRASKKYHHEHLCGWMSDGVRMCMERQNEWLTWEWESSRY